MSAILLDFGSGELRSEEKIESARGRLVARSQVAAVPILEPDVSEYLDIGVDQEEFLELTPEMDDDEYGMG